MGDNNGQNPRDPRESMLWDTVGSQAGAAMSSPAGGPGPGRFKQFGAQGTTNGAGTSGGDGFWDRFWNRVRDRLPHEATKAGVRIIVGPGLGILTDYLLDRYEKNANYVAEACRRALAKYVGAAIEEETGEALEGLLTGLLQGLVMMMAVVATTTLIGAGAGAAVGFFGFGVGAAPGAAVGAELGFDAGVWILNWLGIGFLAVYIGKNLNQVVRALSSGVVRAWNAGEHGVSVDQDLEAGAKDIARAIGILIRLILEGIVMYLLAKGAARVAEQLPGLLKALRESGIGKRLAGIVEKDPEGFVKKHAPKEITEGTAGKGTSEAQTPATEAKPPGEVKPPAPVKGPYSDLTDPPDVGPGKDFTAKQKAEIIKKNMEKNGGTVKSDDPNDFYQDLKKPAKSAKGVTPAPDEWQIDHIVAKDNGGSNSYSNARVISRKLNRLKSND